MRKATPISPSTSTMLLKILVLLVATTTVVRGLASLGNGSVKKLKKPTVARMSVKAKVAQLCRNSPELCQFKAEPKRKEDENEEYMQQEKQIKQRQFNNALFKQRNERNRQIIQVKESDSKRRAPTEVRRPKQNLERKRERIGSERADLLDKDSLTCELSNEANDFISDIFALISNSPVNEPDVKKMFLMFLLEPSPFFTCTSIAKDDARSIAETTANGNYDGSNDVKNNERRTQPISKWGSDDVPPLSQYTHGTAPRGDTVNSQRFRGRLSSRFEDERRKLSVGDVMETKPEKRIYENGVDLIRDGQGNEKAVSKEGMKSSRHDTRVLDELELEMQQKKILDTLMDVLHKQREK